MKRQHWTLKNTNGKHDVLFTFATIGFFVTTFCILLSMFSEVELVKRTIKLNPPDPTLLLGYLSATFTAYVVKRGQDGKETQITEVEEKVTEVTKDHT